MPKLIKRYTYGDTLAHGIRSGDVEFTKLYDIQYRSMEIYNTFMYICNHKGGLKFRVEARGTTPCGNQPRDKQNTMIGCDKGVCKRTSNYKYIKLIPHDSVPNNFFKWEIPLPAI